MNLDGLVAAPDRAGHVLVGQPPGHQRQHLELALGEIAAQGMLGKPNGHGGRDDPLAAVHGADRGDHLGEEHVLQ
jgi:hypothetical protein